jgi:ABC-type transporter Mla maintaining outer membrane lipid asymmetry ATPase subunit MlaF
LQACSSGDAAQSYPLQVGATVLLVEHDKAAVMKISDRIVVLIFGQKIAEGTPAEIQKNDKVIERIWARKMRRSDCEAWYRYSSSPMSSSTTITSMH